MEQGEERRPTFETYDLNLASFLRCRNFRIQDVSDRGRTVFVFEDSSLLRQAIVDYLNDGAVPVRSFCSTLRDLKAITRDKGAPERKSRTPEEGC